jgi:hypothetical protein
VRRAVQSGRIQLVDGLVDPVQASRDWDRNTSKARMPKRARAAATPARQPKPASPPPTPPSDGEPPDLETDYFPDFLTSQAEHEFHKARLAKLKADQEEGKLIDAEAIRKEIFATYRTVRDKLRMIPERLARTIAAETDPAVIHRLIQDEIDVALQEAGATLRSDSCT